MKLKHLLKSSMNRIKEIYQLPKESVSMHRILNISLFLFLTLIMGVLTLVNYMQLTRQNEKLFNIQMVHAANLVDVLVSMNVEHSSLMALAKLLNDAKTNMITQGDLRAYSNPRTEDFYNMYRESFFFQVYDINNFHVLLKSSNAPNRALNVPFGFSTFKFQNKKSNAHWYLFSIKSNYQPIIIVIAVNQDFKNHVVMDLFWALLKEILWMYVLSAILLMLMVRLVFAPLTKITQALKRRNPRSTEPLVVKKIPKEVQPLLDQLNELFVKFNEILERESRFAGDAAHELKTPLAGIKTQIEVALNIDDIDLIKEKMTLALDNIDRYYHIINQLLTLTKLEPKHAQDENNEQIEMNRFSALWIAAMVPVAMDKSIELSLNRSDMPIYVLASRAAFDILFRNILDNAIRYTPERGRVTIDIKLEKEEVILSFTDTGVGVEKDKLERIFDRFYREAGTEVSGSGLGLSIVREIIRIHNGSIKASQAMGGGLKIQIRLPICHNNDSN